MSRRTVVALFLSDSGGCRETTAGLRNSQKCQDGTMAAGQWMLCLDQEVREFKLCRSVLGSHILGCFFLLVGSSPH